MILPFQAMGLAEPVLLITMTNQNESCHRASTRLLAFRLAVLLLQALKAGSDRGFTAPLVLQTSLRWFF